MPACQISLLRISRKFPAVGCLFRSVLRQWIRIPASACPGACKRLQSPMPVAGFPVIEATDLDQAIRIVSKTPCAVTHGVVEVWPLEEG